MATRSGLTSLARDYGSLRTLPALLSVLYIVMGLYAFGGIPEVTLTWIGDYTLTQSHAVIGSTATFAIAFMSSETKSLEHYETAEMGIIAAAFAAPLGWEYVTEFQDFIVGIGDPLGAQLLFVVTLIGWTVAVR